MRVKPRVGRKKCSNPGKSNDPETTRGTSFWLPESEIRLIEEAVRASLDPGTAFHGLRTRKTGSRRFVDLHVTVPGDLCVTDGHDRCGRIEAAIENTLPKTSASTHLEPGQSGDDG